MIEFTQEQKKAYARYISARDKVGLVRTAGYSKRTWIRTAEYDTVDVAGMNHPMFARNDEWFEYKEASLAWWAIEPSFRKDERMSMIRGDYGDSDNWREKQPKVKEI